MMPTMVNVLVCFTPPICSIKGAMSYTSCSCTSDVVQITAMETTSAGDNRKDFKTHEQNQWLRDTMVGLPLRLQLLKRKNIKRPSRWNSTCRDCVARIRYGRTATVRTISKSSNYRGYWSNCYRNTVNLCEHKPGIIELGFFLGSSWLVGMLL